LDRLTDSLKKEYNIILVSNEFKKLRDSNKIKYRKHRSAGLENYIWSGKKRYTKNVEIFIKVWGVEEYNKPKLKVTTWINMYVYNKEKKKYELAGEEKIKTVDVKDTSYSSIWHTNKENCYIK
jgi:hypothetical protein